MMLARSDLSLFLFQCYFANIKTRKNPQKMMNKSFKMLQSRPGVATLFIKRAEKWAQKAWRAQRCVKKSLAGKI